MQISDCIHQDATCMHCSPMYTADIKVEEKYVTDFEDMTRRNVMDGDPFLSSSPSWRFSKPQVEPYVPSQAAGKYVL